MSSPEVTVLGSTSLSHKSRRAKKRKGRPKDDRNYEYAHTSKGSAVPNGECQACTFRNPPAATACGVCGNTMGRVMIDLTVSDSPTTYQQPTPRNIRAAKRAKMVACHEDYQLAKVFQMIEDEAASARKEQELSSMLASSAGKAVSFISEVIKLQARLEPEFQEIGQPGHLTTVAVDDMVFLAENMIELQEEFRTKGLDTAVTIGYHYTKTQNMEGIRKDGLMSAPEREASNVKFIPGGGATYGNGIYTGRNPFSFQIYGDVGLLVAIMKGKVKRFHGYDRADGGANTVIGNKSNPTGSAPHAFDEVVLKQSAQCLPLISFSTSLLGGLSNVTTTPAAQLIWKYHQELQYLVDEFLNGGDEIEPEIVLAGPTLAPVPRVPRPPKLKVPPVSSRSSPSHKIAPGSTQTVPSISTATPFGGIKNTRASKPVGRVQPVASSVLAMGSMAPATRTRYPRACKAAPGATIGQASSPSVAAAAVSSTTQNRLNHATPSSSRLAQGASTPSGARKLNNTSTTSTGSTVPRCRTKYSRACKTASRASIGPSTSLSTAPMTVSSGTHNHPNLPMASSQPPGGKIKPSQTIPVTSAATKTIPSSAQKHTTAPAGLMELSSQRRQSRAWKTAIGAIPSPSLSIAAAVVSASARNPPPSATIQPRTKYARACKGAIAAMTQARTKYGKAYQGAIATVVVPASTRKSPPAAMIHPRTKYARACKGPPGSSQSSPSRLVTAVSTKSGNRKPVKASAAAALPAVVAIRRASQTAARRKVPVKTAIPQRSAALSGPTLVPVLASAGRSSHRNRNAVSSNNTKKILGRLKSPNPRSGIAHPSKRFIEGTVAYTAPRSLEARGSNSYAVGTRAQNEECSVCLRDLSSNVVKLVKCNHCFHRQCLQSAVKHQPNCPICRKPVSDPQGKSPSGTMTVAVIPSRCTGFSVNSLQITYAMQGGSQQQYHPSPGNAFGSTLRTAYLPNNNEGCELLERLKYAFMRGLLFTVGTSLTTGASGVITWSSIHQKTNLGGGSSAHGYPDPKFFFNCNDELDALGVPQAAEIDASFQPPTGM